jgi:hypothetical protein
LAKTIIFFRAAAKGGTVSAKVIEQREMSVDEYLAKFPIDSADYKLLKEKSEKLKTIVVAVVEEDGGRRFEDTTFTEKNGSTYTVRAAL